MPSASLLLIYYLQIALVPACFAFDVNKCIETCILCKYKYFFQFGIKHNLNVSMKIVHGKIHWTLINHVYDGMDNITLIGWL